VSDYFISVHNGPGDTGGRLHLLKSYSTELAAINGFLRDFPEATRGRRDIGSHFVLKVIKSVAAGKPYAPASYYEIYSEQKFTIKKDDPKYYE
jgi:hypothetical protein